MIPANLGLLLLLAGAPAARAARAPEPKKPEAAAPPLSSATAIDDEGAKEAQRRAAEAAVKAANQRRLAALARIPQPQAEAAALALAPNGWLGETELDEDKTRVFYRVLVVTRSRQIRSVRVDAANGHILRVENLKLEDEEEEARFKKWSIPPVPEKDREEKD